LRNVDHEQRQVEGIGERYFLDIHKIFQAPKLLGVAEIELDLETQAVVINDLVVGQLEITAKQIHVGKCTGVLVMITRLSG